MSPATATSAWDFTPVIDLLYSFPTDPQAHRPPAEDGATQNSRETGTLGAISSDQDGPRLGDFGTLWGFLEQSSSSDLPPIAQNGSTLPPASPLKVKPIRLKKGTQPAIKSTIHDSFKKDMESEDDAFQESPIKLKGRFRNPLQASLSGGWNEKGAKERLDTAPILSLSSRAGEKDSKKALASLHESLVSPACSDPQTSPTPMTILARPVPPPQTPKLTAVEPISSSPVRIPCPTYSQLYPTPQKPPRSPPKTRVRIQPVVSATATERRSILVHKLIGKFPEQRKLLLNSDYMAPICSAQASTPGSIHVFVDASNVRQTLRGNGYPHEANAS
jgi:hypothetical protein